jgi:hypothetical protein
VLSLAVTNPEMVRGSPAGRRGIRQNFVDATATVVGAQRLLPQRWRISVPVTGPAAIPRQPSKWLIYQSVTGENVHV